MYNYDPAPPDVLERVGNIEKVCAAYGVKAPQPPFNDHARLAAGFTAVELAQMTARAQA